MGKLPPPARCGEFKGVCAPLKRHHGQEHKTRAEKQGGRVCFATQPVIQPGYFTRISTGLPRRDESTACFVRLPVNAV
ncbi:MAG: hypothetical protein ACLRJV_10930 [Eubacteriales bacterium]